MTVAAQAIATILPVLYLATALLFGMEFGGPRAPRIARIRGIVAGLLVLSHAAYVAVLWTRVGHLPVTDTWNVLSLVAFALLLVYFPVERATKTPATGLFVLGCAFLLQLLASAFAPRDVAPSRLAASPFFTIHIVTAILAIAALFLSGFYGALYLLLFRQIRGRRFGVLFSRLPDLEMLSRLNRGAATLGFVFLTVGLNLGIWWAHSGAVERFSYLDPKVLPVILLWIVFGLIGASRWIKFLSGRRAARIAVLAAALLVLSVIVSFLPRGPFHVLG